MTTSTSPDSLLKQPRAVWAVAFASVIAFMGIGLVDPILKPIGEQLHASPSQVSLLFTSYMLVTGVAMLITGVVSSRFGPKRTLLAGLAVIVVFAALAGMSGSVGEIIGFRAGWGLGNALFIATALSTIVGAASGGVARAIILYEAALGIGIATGPLVGGLLGGFSWRGPFFGVAVLMAIAFILLIVMLPDTPKPAHTTSILDPFRALRHRGLLTVGITALLYNYGFFTLLAYTPFPLDMGTYSIGFIFFGWGLCLAVASVFIAPRLQRAYGTLNMMMLSLLLFAVDLGVMAMFTENKTVLIVGTVVAGLFLGVNNTLITETVMISAPVERSTASAAYSFVRFTGGAAAPYLAGKLGESNMHVPFWVGAACTALAIVVLASGRKVLAHVDEHEPAPHSIDEARAVTVGD
ncbi:MFS transporter [Rhodococcus fascians]|uniref:Multidrug efflux protein YfmO n=1 Tax=Rhodococcoides fascians TaxID=1828 RepID=A0A143QG18_RHOFA|nr:MULTISPECIES: MFS transporter [Rhodococcus]AMY22113.1 Multidrug efflux protein YfmO [Rhodococcus fascians]KJV02554.1 putative multidrug efflux transport protein [Rhodococcus sp. PML026]KMJ51494.1 MFS transporter [Rhodococcus fascians]MBJ7323514.1 MFS transporter [Rhodococcus sp. (in: high G+C Gram-positive bacteria)]MBJ7350864.1 MFS transporter [Rhodococcus sp. (in: high G+C Gram-positive bacteria)]